MGNEEHEERWLRTERYVFHYYHDEESQEITDAFKMRVTLVEGKDMTEDDLNELRSLLQDMGKWENFSNTARNLLEDTQMIGSRSIQEREQRFGFEKYKLEVQLYNGGASIVIRLSPEERRRRASIGGTLGKEWRIHEITGQIENTEKWKMLRRTLLDLRKQI